MRKLFSSKKSVTLSLSLMFFGLMVLVAFVHEDGILSAFRMDQELIKMRDDNKSLVQKLYLLRRETNLLKTDVSSIEKIAREKLNLVKPDERVYQIVR